MIYYANNMDNYRNLTKEIKRHILETKPDDLNWVFRRNKNKLQVYLDDPAFIKRRITTFNLDEDIFNHKPNVGLIVHLSIFITFPSINTITGDVVSNLSKYDLYYADKQKYIIRKFLDE